MSDPRREPDEKPSVVTGVRRANVRKKLDLVAPLPSIPPPEKRNESGAVLQYMYDIETSRRDLMAYTEARAEELREDVAYVRVEFDNFKNQIDQRLERLEDGYKAIFDTVFEISEKQSATDRKIDGLETKWEDSYERFHQRLGALEKHRIPKLETRVDEWETRQQKQHAEALDHIDAIRKQLDAIKGQLDGGPPDTPKVKRDDSGDTGSET